MLKATKDSNTDLVHVYKQYVKTINPVNLALFIDTYCGRTDLKIQRPPNAQSPPNRTLRYVVRRFRFTHKHGF